jgi:hypothetical protein
MPVIELERRLPRYALFGQFFIGLRMQVEQLAAWASGKL